MQRIQQLLQSGLLALLAAVITSSCTEDIKLNLKSAEPHLVIEGNLSNAPGPYTVKFSKSKAYYEGNDFEAVHADYVFIADDAGTTDTLQEVNPGEYQTQLLNGVPGRTYHFQAQVEGKVYDAICQMPMPVQLDSLYFEAAIQGPGGPNNGENTRLRCLFMDPAGQDNYYRIATIENGLRNTNLRIANDRLFDGKLRDISARAGDIQTGDTVQVELWSITESIYNYYNVLNQNNFSNPINASAAPANPPSNFSTDVLGYFNVYSFTTKTVIVP